MTWPRASVTFDLVDDQSDHPITTISITIPSGTVLLMGEVDVVGTTLVIREAHIEGLSANKVGTANLLVMAQAFMEEFGYGALEIEGAVRTTGANKGHRPRPFRFTRRPGA